MVSLLYFRRCYFCKVKRCIQRSKSSPRVTLVQIIEKSDQPRKQPRGTRIPQIHNNLTKLKSCFHHNQRKIVFVYWSEKRDDQRRRSRRREKQISCDWLSTPAAASSSSAVSRCLQLSTSSAAATSPRLSTASSALRLR